MSSLIQAIINNNQTELLANWESAQKAGIRTDLVKTVELQSQMKEFMALFTDALRKENLKNIQTEEWRAVREFLSALSYSRGLQGFTPSETALFVFTLKKCLSDMIRGQAKQSPETLEQVWEVGELLDKLGLFTTEIYQKGREEVILRQQQDMLELSTPVVELAAGIIALPMIGTLDSNRTQVVMETLLQKIVETKADIAIIDITGVPTVDTLVAQHLLKTVTAARLMGAECIISGIRPQIAATIVHLGVELGNVTTKASLASAISLALKRTGYSLHKNGVLIQG